MVYKVMLTEDAELDINRFISYLILEKRNEQAACNLLADFEQTINILKQVAGSLRICSNPRLKELGYRRMNFTSHRYFLLYRLENHTAIVDNVFHELQDYENHLK